MEKRMKKKNWYDGMSAKGIETSMKQAVKSADKFLWREHHRAEDKKKGRP